MINWSLKNINSKCVSPYDTHLMPKLKPSHDINLSIQAPPLFNFLLSLYRIKTLDLYPSNFFCPPVESL